MVTEEYQEFKVYSDITLVVDYKCVLRRSPSKVKCVFLVSLSSYSRS